MNGETPKYADQPTVRKLDDGKNRLDLIPTSLISNVGRVLTFGANKYADRDWEKGIDWNRVYGAALRHMNEFWSGNDIDADSGCPHLACAITELAFLLEFMTTHRELDNRPVRITPCQGFGRLSKEEQDIWRRAAAQ
jgi:hypothetical protein